MRLDSWERGLEGSSGGAEGSSASSLPELLAEEDSDSPSGDRHEGSPSPVLFRRGPSAASENHKAENPSRRDGEKGKDPHRQIFDVEAEEFLVESLWFIRRKHARILH